MAMGQRGQQSDRMMRAAESGNEAAQRAHDARQNRAESARQFDESTRQRELDRWQRQWEQQRIDRRARDVDRARNQAIKPRTTNFGNEGYNPNAEQPVDAKVQLAYDQLAEEQRQFDVSTQLRAAQSGLQMGGGAPGGNSAQDIGRVEQAIEQNPEDPRLQKLLEEMQRGNQQMGMGIESGDRTGRMFVPTPEAMEKDRYEQETSRMNAQTSRANARIRMLELQSRATALQARISGSTGEQRKEWEAALKKVSDEVVKGGPGRWGLAPMVDTLKSIDKGKGTEAQWRQIEQEIAGVDQGRAAEIHAEVARREPGPALRRWMNEGINTKIIEHMAMVAGNFPAGFTDNWDPSTAAATAFKANADSVSKFLKAGISAQLYPITDQSEWSRMVRFGAAIATMRGLAQPTGQPMGQAPSPGGEVVPPLEGQRGPSVRPDQYDWSKEREIHAGRSLEENDFEFKVPR